MFEWWGVLVTFILNACSFIGLIAILGICVFSLANGGELTDDGKHTLLAFSLFAAVTSMISVIITPGRAIWLKIVYVILLIIFLIIPGICLHQNTGSRSTWILVMALGSLVLFGYFWDVTLNSYTVHQQVKIITMPWKT
jgi:hypothetical protein